MNGIYSRIDVRTVRLVSTADHKPPVLQPLAASFGALEKLEELEGVTSGRLAVQQKGLPRHTVFASCHEVDQDVHPRAP